MVSREELRRFVEGHRRASVRLRQEALRRLVSLSVEEARTEYDSLCRVWEVASRTSGDEAALDRRAIEDRVALRRRLRGRR